MEQLHSGRIEQFLDLEHMKQLLQRAHRAAAFSIGAHTAAAACLLEHMNQLLFQSTQNSCTGAQEQLFLRSPDHWTARGSRAQW